MVGRRKANNVQEEFLERNAAVDAPVKVEKPKRGRKKIEEKENITSEIDILVKVEKPTRGRKKNKEKENVIEEIYDAKAESVGKGKKRKGMTAEPIAVDEEVVIEKEVEVKQVRGRKKFVLQETSSQNMEENVQSKQSRPKSRSKKVLKVDNENSVLEEMTPAKKARGPAKRGKKKIASEETQNTDMVSEIEVSNEVKSETEEETSPENITSLKNAKGPAKKGKKKTDTKKSENTETNETETEAIEVEKENVVQESNTPPKKSKTRAKRGQKKDDTEELENMHPLSSFIGNKSLNSEKEGFVGSNSPAKRVKTPARRGKKKAFTEELEYAVDHEIETKESDIKEEAIEQLKPLRRKKKKVQDDSLPFDTNVDAKTLKAEEEGSSFSGSNSPVKKAKAPAKRGRRNKLTEELEVAVDNDNGAEESDKKNEVSEELQVQKGKKKRAQDIEMDSNPGGSKRDKLTETPEILPDSVTIRSNSLNEVETDIEKVAPKKSRGGRKKNAKPDVADVMPSPSVGKGPPSVGKGPPSRERKKPLSAEMAINNSLSKSPSAIGAKRRKLEKNLYGNDTFTISSPHKTAANVTFVKDCASDLSPITVTCVPAVNSIEISPQSHCESPLLLTKDAIDKQIKKDHEKKNVPVKPVKPLFSIGTSDRVAAKKGKQTKIPVKFNNIRFAVKENETPTKREARTPTRVTGTPWQKVTGTPWQKKNSLYPKEAERVKFSAKKMPDFKKLHQKQFEKMESLSAYKERKTERARNLLFSPQPKPVANVSLCSAVVGKKSCLPVRKSNAIKNSNLNKTISVCSSQVTSVSKIREKQTEIIKNVRANKRFLLQLQMRNLH